MSGKVAACAAMETVNSVQKKRMNLFGGVHSLNIRGCRNTIPKTAAYDNWNPTSKRLLGLIISNKNADAASEL